MIGVFGSILKELLGGPGPKVRSMSIYVKVECYKCQHGGQVGGQNCPKKLNCPKYSVNTLYATVTLKEGCCWIAHFASFGTYY